MNRLYTEGLVYFEHKGQSQIHALNTAVVPVSDRGFLIADAVFDTMLAVGGKLIDLTRHLDRLREHLAAQAIESIGLIDETRFRFVVEDLLEQVGAKRVSIRTMVTRGDGFSVRPSGASPRVTVIVRPLVTPPPTELRLKSFPLGYTRRDAQVKYTNYADAARNMERLGTGYDDILWINSENELTEASTANIFLLGREGDSVEIATPPASSGILLGVTRQRIIELLHAAKIPVTERTIYREELPRFDEAFICSSISGLIPVTLIDGHKLMSTRANATFHHIARLYGTWLSCQ